MTNEEKAKEIIERIIYITIATCSKDGVPWNTPVYTSYDEDYNFYWASDQNGQHSKNIKDNNNVFLVVFDSTASAGTGEGVYIKAKAEMLADEEEVQKALGYLYRRSGDSPNKRQASKFLGDYPRRVYKAVPEKFWINGDGNINGNYIDIKIEVDLLK